MHLAGTLVEVPSHHHVMVELIFFSLMAREISCAWSVNVSVQAIPVLTVRTVQARRCACGARSAIAENVDFLSDIHVHVPRSLFLLRFAGVCWVSTTGPSSEKQRRTWSRHRRWRWTREGQPTPQRGVSTEPRQPLKRCASVCSFRCRHGSAFTVRT